MTFQAWEVILAVLGTILIVAVVMYKPAEKKEYISPGEQFFRTYYKRDVQPVPDREFKAYCPHIKLSQGKWTVFDNAHWTDISHEDRTRRISYKAHCIQRNLREGRTVLPKPNPVQVTLLIDAQTKEVTVK